MESYGYKSRCPGVSLRNRLLTIPLIVAVLGPLSFAVSADELDGQELMPIDDLGGLVGSALGGLFSGDDKVRGSVDSVLVVMSRERFVDIEVTYTRLEGGTVEVSVRDSDGAGIDHVPSVEFDVAADSEGSHTKTLRLQLADDAPEGYESRSGRLKFQVRRTGHRTVNIVRDFAFNKLWLAEIAPVNVVVQVRPEPVGTTLQYVQQIRQGGNSGAQPAQPEAPSGLILTPSSSMSSEARERLRRATTVRSREDVPITRDVAVGPTSERSADIRARTNMATAKLPTTSLQRIRIEDYQFKVSREAPAGSTEPEFAPVTAKKDLLSGLQLAVDMEAGDVIPLFRDVYRDRNDSSGMYYYFPRAYNMLWDDDVGGGRGLGLRISYEQLREGDDDEEAVRMAVLLSASVGLRDVQLAREILQAQNRRQNFGFRDLQPFPLAAPPRISLVEDLAARYDLDEDDIAITGLSDALEIIELSWVTDPITAQNMRLALRDGFGINGSASFESSNPQGPVGTIPVNIRIDDADTYGQLDFDRSAEIRNRAPLPIRLQYLHTLVIRSNRPYVYSWSLGDTVVPSLAKIAFDLANVPAGVDSASKRMWIQYAIDRSCEDCVTQTVEEVLNGDLWPRMGEITVRALRPLEDTGAQILQLHLRSRFFEPDVRDLVTSPTRYIEQDGDEFVIKPIFLTSRTAPDGEEEWPLFEYKLDAVFPSGEIREGQNWIPSDNDRVFIGRVQVEQSVGELP